MEGLEATTITKSKLNQDLRYEAEFFQKRYLAEDSALDRWTKQAIGDFAKVTDGPHGYHILDESSPIVMLTAKNLKDWFANRIDADPIAESVDVANRRSSLEVGDVVLSTRGTVGLCALITKEVLPANIDQDVARITLEKPPRFLPEFLLAYLNSSFGQDHIGRYASGMVQQGLSLQKVRDILVPTLSQSVQHGVAEIIQKALLLRREEAAKWLSAEQVLLRALGLESWQPPEPLTYTTYATEVFSAKRFDAEYFQPKYKALLKHISRNAVRCRYIKVFAESCERGQQPKYFKDGTLAVVTSQHILENGLDYDNFERTRPEFWAYKNFLTARIRRGDILTYTTGAKVGRTAAYLSDTRALASNHVNVLRLIEENPIYVAFVINSIVGRMQTMMFVTGSAQAELYPNDILRFLIPFVEAKEESAITQAMISAHEDRRKAHTLLEQAKRGVEIAIENSEAAALSYLNQLAV